MLILVETAAGYGLFKVENSKLIESDVKDIEKNVLLLAKKQEKMYLCTVLVNLKSFKMHLMKPIN